MTLLHCHHCGHDLRVKDDLAGKRARCPKCGKITQIPDVPSEVCDGVSRPKPSGTNEPCSSAAISPNHNAVAPDTKLCPFCGEEIQRIAKKCKHCGELLVKRKEITFQDHRPSRGRYILPVTLAVMGLSCGLYFILPGRNMRTEDTDHTISRTPGHESQDIEPTASKPSKEQSSPTERDKQKVDAEEANRRAASAAEEALLNDPERHFRSYFNAFNRALSQTPYRSPGSGTWQIQYTMSNLNIYKTNNVVKPIVAIVEVVDINKPGQRRDKLAFYRDNHGNWALSGRYGYDTSRGDYYPDIAVYDPGDWLSAHLFRVAANIPQ